MSGEWLGVLPLTHMKCFCLDSNYNILEPYCSHNHYLSFNLNHTVLLLVLPCADCRKWENQGSMVFQNCLISTFLTKLVQYEAWLICIKEKWAEQLQLISPAWHLHRSKERQFIDGHLFKRVTHITSEYLSGEKPPFHLPEFLHPSLDFHYP